ncbi:solute carrier family 2, facilitated glucose transporter member 6-like isoform X1 [Planococcus citri]|uniref:solute carrier family 2, facilitated glucose transporter member 6-like isoform X1 n=2 Tax=Planococcus citri TaxID=170843 RepID=UPI0031FA158F
MYLCTFSHFRQFLIFIPVGILAMLYGCAVGWTSVGIVGLQQPDSKVPLEKSDTKLIAAFFELGRFSSAIPAGLLGDRWGRKTIILICSVQHLLAWSLIILTESINALFLARFLSGLAVGTGNAVLFIYAGEMSPPRIRGTILSLMYTCYYLGILIEYIFGACLTYELVAICSLAVCSLFFVFIFFIKESPSYLLTKSKDDKAKSIYKWLNNRRPEDEVNKEFEAIKEYVNNQNKNKESSVSGFSDPVNRKCVSLVFIINFLTQLTGLPVLIAFVHTVFKSSTNLTANQFGVIFGALQYIAGCSATLLSDKIGRRKMYKLTCISCAFCHAVTAILFFIDRDLGYEVPFMSWYLLISISLYACIYAAGLGPLTVIVRGELLPQAVKGIGSGLAVVSAGVSCFLLVFIFHFIQDTFGITYNFVFFFFVSIALALLTHFKLPETKHKTLAEIQEAFRNS